MNAKAKIPARGGRKTAKRAPAKAPAKKSSAKSAARKKAARKPAARPAAKKPATRKTAATATKPVAKKPAAGKAAATATKPVAKKPRAAKPAVARKRPRARSAAGTAPRTLDEFMAQALVMENEAAQRYTELADMMEMHNNREVAALFRKMAEIEGRHAQQIMAEMGWTSAPAAGKPPWDSYEAPESAATDDVHYLMQPYHALEVALAAEQRAERFFARLVRAARTESVRKAARELHEEEREHVRLVREWMDRVPKPDADWANDPDPPVYTD